MAESQLVDRLGYMLPDKAARQDYVYLGFDGAFRFQWKDTTRHTVDVCRSLL